MKCFRHKFRENQNTYFIFNIISEIYAVYETVERTQSALLRFHGNKGLRQRFSYARLLWNYDLSLTFSAIFFSVPRCMVHTHVFVAPGNLWHGRLLSVFRNSEYFFPHLVQHYPFKDWDYLNYI